MDKKIWSCLVLATLLLSSASGQENDPSKTVEPGSPHVRTSEVSPASAPKLVVRQPHVDLGVVRQGRTYDFSYVLTNEGLADLRIKRIRSTCGCTVTRPDKPQLLKPGDSMVVDASFDSKGRLGSQKKTIEVYSNDPTSPIAQLTFEATVEALYQLRPKVFPAFQNKQPGEQLDHTLRLLAGKAGTDIEILDLRFNRGGMTCVSEPIVETGFKGHRLTFELEDNIPIGHYHALMSVRIKCNDEEAELKVPISGSVISDIAVSPRYLLEVAPVLPGEEITYGRITLRAVRRDSVFHVRRVDHGEDLTYSMEELQAGLEYRLTFSVAESARKGPLARTITIFTDNLAQPVITVPAYVNIGSPIYLHPEAVFLHRQQTEGVMDRPLMGSQKRASQTLTLHPGFAKGFDIEGASTDNPVFRVQILDQEVGILDRKLVVTLAESAPVGEHEGQLTVFCNIPGAKELTIPLYGEVVELP